MSRRRQIDKRMVDEALSSLAEADEMEHRSDYRVEQARAERWIAQAGADALPKAWTPDLVRARLNAAMDALGRSVSRPGPASVRSVMPEYERSQLSIRDLIDQMNDGSLHLLTNRVGLSALSQQVSRMEQAIYWPAKYLARWPGPRRILNTMLVARATRTPWARVLRKKGIPYSTAKDARARALRIIADGLNRDGVPVK